MKRALLLNADWTPMHFVDEEEAIYLVYLEKAEMITLADGKPSAWPQGHKLVDGSEFPAGATLRLVEHVKKKWRQPRFRKSALFNRDGYECQYCRTKLTAGTATIEHILPSSRGGSTSWLNCVTACSDCNRKKRNRTPQEANMELLKQPAPPLPIHFWTRVNEKEWHPDWDYFIGSHT